MTVQTMGPVPGTTRRLTEVELYGALFAGAVLAFCLSKMIGDRLGLGSDVIAVAGNATCGWSWLLVRTLFQPVRQRPERWPLLVVLALVAISASLRLAEPPTDPLPRILDNVAGLISSALLLLAAIEPIKGLNLYRTRPERRFRLAFAAGYASLLVVSVVWVNGAPAGSVAADWNAAIKGVCAALALVGMGMAVWFRRHHPLPEVGPTRPRARTADDVALEDRLLRLMRDDTLYARPNLRIADLARLSGQPEYRVTQCVTGGLGFRNFNQMANRFRIDEAKRRLADPAFAHLPILTIAYDCGFASIGPFNRAFKAETGVTPKGFRRSVKTAQGPTPTAQP